jgi:flagellar hook-associated protein 2
MAITSIGTGSGIDLESLVQNLINAEREPVEGRLSLRETTIGASISGVAAISGALADLKSSLASLKSSSFFTKRQAVSTDNSLFLAQATSGATLGNYNIEVFEKASAHKLATRADFANPDEIVGTGTLTISVGGSSFDVNITAGENDSVEGIKDAINDATDNTGVTASLLTVDNGLGDGGTVTKLVLTADDSGESNAIEIDVADDDLINNDASGLSQLFYKDGDVNNQVDQINAAQDARIAVDGFTVKSATDTFEGVIEGVKIILLKEADDILDPPSAELIIAADNTSAKGAVETFAASYNAFMAVMNQLTDYDPISQTRGLLSGDNSIATIESNIRRIFSDRVDGAAKDMNSFAFIGFSTNKNGTISVNDADLSKAINTRFDDLQELFAGDDGIAKRLESQISSMLSVGGVIDIRTTGFQKQLDDIAIQRDTLDFRLSKMEATLRSKFGALDIQVAQLNQTGDFLATQLAAVAKAAANISNKK